MTKTFSVVIEQDKDGYYIGSIPELPGCHTQAKTLDELAKRIKEAASLYISVKKEEREGKFIGVQVVEV